MAEESRLQTKILKDLRYFGKYCVCAKIERTSDDGFPDIFFSTAVTGAVLIEVKAEKGIISDAQNEMIEKLNHCGTRTFICNSWEMWVEIKKQIGIYDKEFVKNYHNKMLS